MIGAVLSVVLFAISYGRIDQVREVAFGDTHRSNVDRPPAERAALAAMGERVQILRLHGFVFFGTANGLLERIRERVEAGAPAVPGDRSPAGERGRFLGGVAFAKVNGSRRRTGSSWCSPGRRIRFETVGTRRGRRRRGRSSGSNRTWIEDCSDARTGPARGRARRRTDREDARAPACLRGCGRTSIAWRSPKGPC